MANQGGSSCRLRYRCAVILMRHSCGVWQRRRKTALRARRLLALPAMYDGVARTEAAKIGGVGLQIIRDWVLHFNERGPDGLLNGKSPGQPSKLNDVQRQAIARIIESGPIPAVHGVVRLVRDNDGAYGQAFTSRVRAMGIRDRLSPRSPWQNAYVERLIGTLRRDCLDHVLIFGERHLRRVLTLYSVYYNETRTHLGLGKDAPLRRAVQRSGAIVTAPVLSGLHHRYARI